MTGERMLPIEGTLSVVAIVPLTTIYEIVVTAMLTLAVAVLIVHRLFEKFGNNPPVGSSFVGQNHAEVVQRDEDESPRMVPDVPAELADEILSDEDRVINMLEANGGRLRQMTIVEETDWSKSKVSRLLSKMEEEGEIEKISMGRENLIALAEVVDENVGE